MDSTLLGALIGGGFALAGSIVTAVATYLITSKQENKKLITQKKEAIYIAVENLKIDTTSRFTALLNIINEHDVNLEQFQRYEPSHLASLNMLMSLYFKDLNEYRNKMNEMHKELNSYLMQIYSPKTIIDKGPDFSGEFLRNAQSQYRQFIKHVDEIQKVTVNID
ncbi:TPA: hypothetical protein KNG84_002541 [Serratia fonticola]|nr:hypothetical protein [Serratia fonticola]